MSMEGIWLWDDTNKGWLKALCDTSGKLIISDEDPFEIVQNDPNALRHAPYGHCAAIPAWKPFAVDANGKLQIQIASLARLNDIDNVNIASPADNDLIRYDSGTSKWLAVAVAASRIIGRKSSGDVAALTGAEIMVILTGQVGAAFSFNSQRITSVSPATTLGDAIVADANIRAPDSTLLEGSTEAQVQDHTPQAHTLASHAAGRIGVARFSWGTDKLLVGAGVGADPTEIDVPTGAYTEGARVYNSADITVGNTSEEALTFDSEDFDTDTIHDTSTNTSRLTCKTAGKYIIVGTIRWKAHATGVRYAFIEHNTAATIGISGQAAVDGANWIAQTVVAIYDMAVNEYVELLAYQSSGGNLDVEGSTDKGIVFSMMRIG